MAVTEKHLSNYIKKNAVCGVLTEVLIEKCE